MFTNQKAIREEGPFKELMPFDMKLWRIKNKDRIREYNQKYMPKYYEDHKEELKQKATSYRISNLDRIQEHDRNRNRKDYKKERYWITKERLMSILGYRCAICHNETNIALLEIHHVNHDGVLDRRRFGRGGVAQIYSYYVKHPEEAKQKLQCTCITCHKKYHTRHGYRKVNVT